jgi:hypothetical protein
VIPSILISTSFAGVPSPLGARDAPLSELHDEALATGRSLTFSLGAGLQPPATDKSVKVAARASLRMRDGAISPDEPALDAIIVIGGERSARRQQRLARGLHIPRLVGATRL